jgi:hypothetical protein
LVSKRNKPLIKLMDHTRRIWIKVAQERVDPLGAPLLICWDIDPKISQGDGVLAAGFMLADAVVDEVAVLA